jgi:hypothetical protein
MGRPLDNLTGQTFGRLEVLARAPSTGRKARWNCVCTCGNTKIVSGSSLRSGGTVSCGCARRERMSVRGPGATAWKGGVSGYALVHARLRCDRGPASENVCVDCGGRARDWSYEGNAPDERADADGVPYTPDHSYYVPRCGECHRRQHAAQRAAAGLPVAELRARAAAHRSSVTRS